MILDKDDIDSLALCAWKEARGDGMTACQAVIDVILNRSRDWNKLIHNVIYDKNQFTSMSVPSDLEFNLKPELNDQIYSQCVYLAGNLSADITYGAHYYCNPKEVTSGWFYRNIVRNPKEHPQTVLLGRQVFYV